MESPLGPVLTGIFMVELETQIAPNVVLNWKRFVAETVAYMKNGSIDIILLKFNSFDPNIQFTVCWDVLLIRNRNFIETKVYRKSTNNNIYLN